MIYGIQILQETNICYGVATISRLIIGLFCKTALEKRLYSAKETCNLKEPTNRSHPILDIILGETNFAVHILQEKNITKLYGDKD